MGVEKVAGPCMQMLIELEAVGGEAEVEGSLMDAALSGLITELSEDLSFCLKCFFLNLFTMPFLVAWERIDELTS